MKYLIYSFILLAGCCALLSSTPLYAQSTTIDSLETLLQLYDSEGRHDTTAAKLHTKVSWLLNNQGKMFRALEHFFKALNIYESLGSKRQIANILDGIATTYSRQGRHSLGLEFGKKSLQMFRELGDNNGVASVLIPIGLAYQEQGRYSEALQAFRQSQQIFADKGAIDAVSTMDINIGDLYRRQALYDSALAQYSKALPQAEQWRDKRSLTFALMGVAYCRTMQVQGNQREALRITARAAALADSIHFGPMQLQALKLFAMIYRKLGSYEQAFDYMQQYMALKDSTENLQSSDEVNLLQKRYEEEKKRNEIRMLEKNKELQSLEIKQQRVIQYSLAGILAAVSCAAVWLGRLYRQKQRANEEILRQQRVLEDQAREIELTNTALQQAHQESESLLLNILPAPIAHRLKSGERAIADRFDSVTVLFADIVGFTKLSTQTTPEELVQGLNAVFERFDDLAKKYGLEKIKTIGDAYMVAGGLPEWNADHCERVAMFALEIQTLMHEESLRTSTGERVQLRIGIHTGEAVAGVIGTSKFAYDLWGDTVNTASRMESHGEAGTIHCSEAVYEALKDKFVFEERGEIEIKGKGMMRTWFLTGAKA